MKKLILTLIVLAFFIIKNQAQTVTDIDGNIYNTITIGSQTWMKENLKVTHYNNGDTIAKISNNTQWSNTTSGAYCFYNNNQSYASTNGLLYNFYTVVDPRKLCPTGWQIATDAEWTVLTDYLGGLNIAGGKLKETGTVHWSSPNTGATNEVGFTALPGGYRANNEAFIGIGSIGSWWCSTESSGTEGWARGVFYDAITVDRGGYYEKKMGFSVRCIFNNVSNLHNDKIKDIIKIYPNPTNEFLNITNVNNENIDITILDLNGKIVYKAKTSNNTIDISKLQKGSYIIKLHGIDWDFEEKIIKN